jgi:cell division protein FtsL
MRKQNSRKKSDREMKFFSFTCFFTLISVIVFFVGSLGLKTYNNSLSIQKQEMETQIASTETQNDSLQVEIRQLASADRVNEVAASNGMSYNQNNISTVSDGTTSTDGE